MLITGSYKHIAIPELSLNTNGRMYLYDTPRDTMAKDLMLQILCSTSTWNAPELMPNIKHLINHMLQGPCPTQNISSIMCFRVHAQHNQHIYHQQLAYAQYTKQIIMFICNGVLDPI